MYHKNVLPWQIVKKFFAIKFYDGLDGCLIWLHNTQLINRKFNVSADKCFSLRQPQKGEPIKLHGEKVGVTNVKNHFYNNAVVTLSFVVLLWI